MRKLMLKTQTGTAYSDIMVYDENKNLVYANLYHENFSVLSSITANINIGTSFWAYQYEANKEDYELDSVGQIKTISGAYRAIAEQKEFFNEKKYVAITCHDNVVKKSNIGEIKDKDSLYILCTADEDDTLFNVLFNRYNIPLLREFIPYLKRVLIMNGELVELSIYQSENSFPSFIKGYEFLCPSEETMKEIIYEGFQVGALALVDTYQKEISVKNLDEYMEKFGGNIINHVDKLIYPLMKENKDEVDAPLKRRPFISQARRINGMVNLLNDDNVGFYISTMGCGKTLKALATVEEYHYRKGKKDYRALIMCPGHLQSNWEDEIKMTIPDAKIKVLESLKDVQDIVYSKSDGKMFYIIGKDFLKLSYSETPAVIWGKGNRYECTYKTKFKVDEEGEFVLDEQGERIEELDLYNSKGKYVGKQSVGRKAINKRGWLCPDCGKVIYTPKSYRAYTKTGDEAFLETLTRWSFNTKKEENQFCCHCGAKLWKPKVKNLESTDLKLDNHQSNKWVKVAYKTGYTATEKTAFVYREFLEEFEDAEDNKVREGTLRFLNESESRRIAPMDFLRTKGYKGLFDFVIFDEIHKYQNQSGQGTAMHVLANLAKKRIGLTGTLFNGKAESIWYMLWRLCPQRMIKKGYTFSSKSLLAFNEEYGAIEEQYSYDSKDDFLANVRAKKTSNARTIPGISPKLYQEFLINSCIFMDLKDIEVEEGKKILPPFDEQLVTVEMDDELKDAYTDIEKSLMEFIRSRQKGCNSILGSMVSTLNAYPDIPKGWGKILNPYNGLKVCETRDLFQEDLYAKEIELLKIVRAEVKAGRRCIVFATSTNKHDVQPRIEKLLLKEGIKAKTMYSSSPNSKKRRDWIKDQVAKGCQVLICNPELVETGLNLLEFPTIIYMQTGYVLATLWQSSRRSWRIGQKKRVKVFYMAYKDSLQERAIKLMGSKLKASASIQGEFSSEGIQALSQNTNILTQLAQELHAKAMGEQEEHLDTIWDDSTSLLELEETIVEEKSTQLKLENRRTILKEKKPTQTVIETIFRTVGERGIKPKGRKAPVTNQLMLFDF